MRTKIDSNYLFAALSCAGVGAPLYLPDEKWIGPTFLILAALVLLFGVRIDGFRLRRSRPHLGRFRLSIYVAVMIAGGLLLVGGGIGALVEHLTRDPIEWNFHSLLPGYTTADGRHYISKLWVTGIHRETQPIKIGKAIFRSRLTGEQKPVQIGTQEHGYVPLEEVNEIPAQASIELQALFWDPHASKDGEPQGILARDFLQKWGDFTFAVTVSGRQHEYEFGPNEVTRRLSEANPPPSPKPFVTKITDVPPASVAAKKYSLKDVEPLTSALQDIGRALGDSETTVREAVTYIADRRSILEQQGTANYAQRIGVVNARGRQLEKVIDEIRRKYRYYDAEMVFVLQAEKGNLAGSMAASAANFSNLLHGLADPPTSETMSVIQSIDSDFTKSVYAFQAWIPETEKRMQQIRQALSEAR